MKLSIRSRIMLPVSILFLVSGLLFAIAVYLMVKNLTDNQMRQAQESFEQNLKKQEQMIKGSYAQLKSSIEQKALEQAAMMSQLPEVEKAFRIALSGKIDDENDPKGQEARELLRKACAPYLKGYKDNSDGKDFQLHYHLPNGHSLARLWRDGWQTKRDGKKVDISDDISAFRPTVTLVNQSRKPVYGIEVGSGGLVIRGLCPVCGTDGEHLGSNEVISPFNPIVYALKTTEDEQFAVLMDARLLNIATNCQDPEKFPRIGSQFILCAATDMKESAALLQSNRDALAEALQKECSFLLGAEHISTFPIKDFGGTAVGVFVSMLDISSQQQVTAQRQDEIRSTLFRLGQNVALGTLAAVVVVGIIMWFVSGSISRGVLESVQQLRALAEKLTEASRSISDSSQQLAEGATEQASSLEETSSALEELAGQARGNAEGAHNVNGMMIETQKVVEQTSEAMRQMVQTMHGIKESSGKVSGIIKTIEGIAFQTNLLALNAAVEAARAGEHGKGFAVVAEEVRNLAQRVAEAARQTGSLIEESVGNANRGAEMVEQAARKVEQVNDSAVKVSENVSSIATASNEQSDGIAQINNAMAEMDKVTQRVAANSEESASASAELSGQADEMLHVVNHLATLVRGDDSSITVTHAPQVGLGQPRRRTAATLGMLPEPGPKPTGAQTKAIRSSDSQSETRTTGAHTPARPYTRHPDFGRHSRPAGRS